MAARDDWSESEREGIGSPVTAGLLLWRWTLIHRYVDGVPFVYSIR